MEISGVKTGASEGATKSIIDKMNDISVSETGEVVHNFFKNSKNGKPRKFKDEETFKKWA